MFRHNVVRRFGIRIMKKLLLCFVIIISLVSCNQSDFTDDSASKVSSEVALENIVDSSSKYADAQSSTEIAKAVIIDRTDGVQQKFEINDAVESKAIFNKINSCSKVETTENLPSISFLCFYFFDSADTQMYYYTLFDTGILWINTADGNTHYKIANAETTYSELIDFYKSCKNIVKA